MLSRLIAATTALAMLPLIAHAQTFSLRQPLRRQ